MELTRRQLIKGFAAAGTATYLSGPSALAKPPRRREFIDFTVIAPSDADVLQVPDGYVTDLLISYGDEFGEGLRFGYNCDYTAYFPLRGDDEGILWVNHEYAIPYYVTDWRQSPGPDLGPAGRAVPQPDGDREGVGRRLARARQAAAATAPGASSRTRSCNRRFTAARPMVPYDGPVARSGLVPRPRARWARSPTAPAA